MGCGYRTAMAGGGTMDDAGHGHRSPLFRSGWEIAAMVGGFVIFFPVGLAILGISSGARSSGWDGGEARGEFKRWKREMKAQWRDGRMGGGSGNVAFDDYRSEVLRRLDEERRRSR